MQWKERGGSAMRNTDTVNEASGQRGKGCGGGKGSRLNTDTTSVYLFPRGEPFRPLRPLSPAAWPEGRNKGGGVGSKNSSPLKLLYRDAIPRYIVLLIFGSPFTSSKVILISLTKNLYVCNIFVTFIYRNSRFFR